MALKKLAGLEEVSVLMLGFLEKCKNKPVNCKMFTVIPERISKHQGGA